MSHCLRLCLRVALVAAALANACRAQFSETIQLTQLNINSVPTTVAFTNANIGQGAHILQIRLANAPGHTCPIVTPSIAQAELDYSVDGSNWFPLSVFVSNPSVGAVTNSDIRYATGAFPNLRIIVQAFDTTNCVASVFYSGSLFPVGEIPSEFNGYFTAGALVQTGVLATGPTSLAPNLPAVTLINHKLSVYGLQLINSSAAAETVTMLTGVNANCGGGSDTAFLTAVLPANGGSYILNTARVPWYSNACNSGAGQNCSQVCYQLGANASTHNFQAQVVYRIEP